MVQEGGPPMSGIKTCIDSSARMGALVRVGNGTFIGAYTLIGIPSLSVGEGEVVIGKDCEILHHVVIEPGANLGDRVHVDHFCRVGSGSLIGNDTRILYGARVHENVVIGENCRIAGNCPDMTKIGNHVTHMGRINHSYNFPFEDWDGPSEIAATVEDCVVIGANALLIGNIRIGRNTFIAPGEIIRRDIPPDSFCSRSQIRHLPNWPAIIKLLPTL